MKNGKSRQGLVEKINRSLDISPVALPRGTLISIGGRESVTIEGRIKILLYSPSEIVLRLGKDTLYVRGERLVCSAYHSRFLMLEGYISSVSFKKECENA